MQLPWNWQLFKWGKKVDEKKKKIGVLQRNSCMISNTKMVYIDSLVDNWRKFNPDKITYSLKFGFLHMFVSYFGSWLWLAKKIETRLTSKAA